MVSLLTLGIAHASMALPSLNRSLLNYSLFIAVGDHSTFNTQHSTLKIQHSTLEIQHSKLLKRMKKNGFWEAVLRIAIAALTAALTALGTASCKGYFGF